MFSTIAKWLVGLAAIMVLAGSLTQATSLMTTAGSVAAGTTVATVSGIKAFVAGIGEIRTGTTPPKGSGTH
jgi:hypothetical protein